MDEMSFDVPMRYDLLGSINQNITRSLFQSRQYKFSTSVSIEVFQSFITYWQTTVFPENNINENNIYEYDLLSQEVQNEVIQKIINNKKDRLDLKLINIQKLQNPILHDKSQIEESIAQHLDDYINNYSKELFSLPIQNLYNIFNHQKRKLTQINRSYEQIIDHYNRTNDPSNFILLPSLQLSKLSQVNQLDAISSSAARFNFKPRVDTSKMAKEIESMSERIRKLEEINNLLLISHEQRCPEWFLENKEMMKQASETADVEEMRKLVLPRCKDKNGIEFMLDPTEFTAEIVDSEEASGNLVIPRYVIYKKDKYTIKSIGYKSLQNKEIKSITFSEDSAIKSIKGEAFCQSEISSITIPASVTELCNNWCFGIKSPTKISVSSNNKFIKMIDDGLIVGKSSEENDEYDILYFGRRDLTSVQIPSNIKVIASCCFDDCELLERVEFSPESKLIKIGEGSFRCSKINKITIPKHVKEIGNYAFCMCENLTTIEFSPESELIKIGDSSFFKSGIVSITIPKNVKEIDQSVFNSCEKLTTIEFSPKSELRSIGMSAFSSSPIRSITIPASVTELSNGWCCEIGAETEVLVSSNNKFIKMIDNGLIVGKSSEENDEYDILYFGRRDLTSVQIPSNIKVIASFCFDNCKLLERVEFSPESKLIKIEEGSFHCSKINKITIPKHVKEIGNYAFCMCENLTTIDFSPETELIKIGFGSFHGSGIVSITIPKHVKEIGIYAFSSCNNLTTIEFSPESELIKIGENSFYGSSIVSITIPKHVKEIKRCTFLYCGKLTTIKFSPESELIKIGESSFYGSSIVSITIPKHVKEIEREAFSSCKILKTIEFSPESEIRSFGTFLFNESTIENITIPASVTELCKNWCFDIKSPTKISVSSNNKFIKMIDDGLIVGKSSEENDEYDILYFGRRDLTSVQIPSNIKVIASCCFDNCELLERVEFSPESKLIKIEEGSFRCSKINKITIPKHVKEIGNDAFCSCKYLKQVEFSPDSELIKIGEESFYESGIVRISIPKHVKEIGNYAFCMCENLVAVNVTPDSELSIIGPDSFSCTFLCHVRTVDDLKKL